LPSITEAQWNTKMKQGDCTGLYLIYGTENYIKQHYAETLRKKTVSPDFESFNFKRFEGKQTTLDDVNDAVEAMPFMSETKCVLVQDYPLETMSDTDAEKLTEILRDVPECCALLFLMLDTAPPSRKTKKWNAVFELFQKHGSVLEVNKKGTADLKKIIMGGVAKRGNAIDSATAEYFIVSVGNDLNLLLGEVEKLCAYCKGRAITQADVDMVAVKSLEASVFDIAKMLTQGRLDRALSMLDILKSQRAEPVMVHGALVSSFVNMYRVRVAAQAGKRPDALTAVIPGLNAYALRYAAQDAQNLPVKSLREALEELHRADSLLKGSAVENWLILEQTMAALWQTLRGKKK